MGLYGNFLVMVSRQGSFYGQPVHGVGCYCFPLDVQIHWHLLENGDLVGFLMSGLLRQHHAVFCHICAEDLRRAEGSPDFLYCKLTFHPQRSSPSMSNRIRRISKTASPISLPLTALNILAKVAFEGIVCIPNPFSHKSFLLLAYITRSSNSTNPLNAAHITIIKRPPADVLPNLDAPYLLFLTSQPGSLPFSSPCIIIPLFYEMGTGDEVTELAWLRSAPKFFSQTP